MRVETDDGRVVAVQGRLAKLVRWLVWQADRTLLERPEGCQLQVDMIGERTVKPRLTLFYGDVGDSDKC